VRLTLVITALLLATAAPAAAYPQFQLATGNTRCSQCHIAPGGGGLLNGWGRGESADVIALDGADAFAGNPKLLYGLWDPPKWLALGFEYRGAGLYKKMPDQAPYFVMFPMQADVQAGLIFGAWSFQMTAGLRGGARDDDAYPSVERLVSREHFLMWRPKASGGPYARLGRFFPVFGLRVGDHTAYIRRRLGFHTLEEPTGLGGGWIRDRWEVHASVYVASPIWHPGLKTDGGTLYYERRLGERMAVGAQSKMTVGDGEVGWLGGGTGKWWLPGPRLLLMGELDAGIRHLTDGPNLLQLAAYAGVTWFAHRGVHLGAVVERYHADLELEAGARDSLTFHAQFFPRAHLELHALTKLEFQGNQLGRPNGHGLLMLHFWL
jgi:hypothetical protein